MLTLTIAVERVTNGDILTDDDLCRLLSSHTLTELTAASQEITQRCASRTFNTCAIINAKADGCSCDCAWCAQSRHWNAAPAETDLIDEKIALLGAKRTRSHGIGRYSLVTAGRKLSPRVRRQAEALLGALTQQTPELELCASFGLMNETELRSLKAAGLVRYHCNLESSERFFKKVCTTHTREDKIRTLEAARRAGLELCSGGLFGMGETEADRMELARTLRRLEIASIPLNFLSPIPGTPLAKQAPLSEEEILRTVVIFRFLNPTAYLRLAGGRQQLSRELLEKVMAAGVNSAIMGDFLTTTGSTIRDDLSAAIRAGMELEPTVKAALALASTERDATNSTTCRPERSSSTTARARRIPIVAKAQI